MKCIIPLAGPDIYTIQYGLKPAYDIEGNPLIFEAIKSRCWYKKTLFEEDLIFVIRDFEHLENLQKLLQNFFPNAKRIIIPELTKGALMSSLTATSLIKNFTEPIIIDLVDILFNGNFDPIEIFKEDNQISGILPYFISNNSKYSFMKLDKNSNVLLTREKQKISKYASAGVYFFKNINIFLEAVKFSIENFDELSVNSLLFLCPSFNSIIENQKTVKAVNVSVYNEISLQFD